MSAELKPCPFCGGTNVDSKGMVFSNMGVLFCHGCGCFGPHPAYDTLNPTPTWNTRTLTDDTVPAPTSRKQAELMSIFAATYLYPDTHQEETS